ncbi:hypothetical protein GJ744_001911 [Endocarpon pusillum]|uniref:Major facilitator superfamily (MFS) profile domain-containing protein n=1 Tax=Endocarpon pusillum TaxID=364733 RepID=A0A8H7ANI0_9EURO|nr:hypothetical protein GJ744_001911 [Endocarpon pusillum]
MRTQEDPSAPVPMTALEREKQMVDPHRASDEPAANIEQMQQASHEVEGEAQQRGGPFNEQTKYMPPSRVITFFLACASVDLVALIDQTTLAVSLPMISANLRAGSLTPWIANGYFVTFTSFQLVYGRLSDIWSRKLILLFALFIFFLGSLACSLSQTPLQLVVFRAMTGIGGAGLMTIAQGIVSDVVTLRERGKYQGILAAVVALSNGVGPVIGGVSASRGGESCLFLTLFTAGCVVFFMPRRKVEGSWQKKLKAVDFPGALLTLLASSLVVLGLSWAGDEYAWSSVQVLVTLSVGAFLAASFILWEWKGHPFPLMPLSIFKERMANGACLTMFVNGWNFVVQVYYIPIFYQVVYGYGPVKAGTLLLPLVLMQTLSSTLSGLVVSWLGRYREVILAGWAVWAVGLGLFSTLDEHSGLGKQVGYGLLTGLGVGQTLQPSFVAIQAGVSRKEMAVVTAKNLGGSFGHATAGTVLNNLVRASLMEAGAGLSTAEIAVMIYSPSYLISGPETGSATRELFLRGYLRGFRFVFLTGAGLAVLAFCVAFFLVPELDLKREDDQRLKREGENKRLQARRLVCEGHNKDGKNFAIGGGGGKAATMCL